MSQTVLNVAYGMNGSKIPSMTNKQLISAFFMASENLPSINTDDQGAISHNMALIADEMSDRVDQAKGQHRIRLEVHLMVMREIVKKLYA
jgi:hypothetical protein